MTLADAYGQAEYLDKFISFKQLKLKNETWKQKRENIEDNTKRKKQC